LEEYPPIIGNAPPTLTNYGQLLETIYGYCDEESQELLTFCIFCAFNTSTDIKANIIPYIDISELQRNYQKLKGNIYTASIVDLGPIMEKILGELRRISDTSAFNRLPSPTVIKDINTNIEYLTKATQINPETILAITNSIIDILIRSNDSTPLGTLDFTSEQGAKRFLGANTCSIVNVGGVSEQTQTQSPRVGSNVAKNTNLLANATALEEAAATELMANSKADSKANSKAGQDSKANTMSLEEASYSKANSKAGQDSKADSNANTTSNVKSSGGSTSNSSNKSSKKRTQKTRK
jgi:hypothetical protein